ncbi:MAG: hypothetical protein AB1758_30040, partial [Candidatus Eremiobacterota bacterium]
MRAVVYSRQEAGGYQPCARVKVGVLRDAPAAGSGTFGLVSPGSRALNVVDPEGHQRFSQPCEDFVTTVQYQPGMDRYLVQTCTGIQAVQAESGQPVASITPENHSHQATMQVLSDGRLALNAATWSESGQLLMLQPDLTPAWNHDTDLLGARFLELGEGRLAAFDGSHLEVLEADGTPCLTSDHLVGEPIRRGEELVYLETSRRTRVAGRISEEEHGRWLCRYNLATGQLSRCATCEDAETVTALPDGRFLVCERAPSRYALNLHDAGGECIGRVPLPEEECLGQLELSADGNAAMLVAGDLNFRMRVYRVDLSNLEMTVVHEQHGDMVVSALSDGRTAVFHAGGVKLVEDGSQFESTAELLSALPPGTRPANERVESRRTAFVTCRPGEPEPWDRLFNVVHHRVKLASAARQTAVAGQPFTTPDCSLNFLLPSVDALPAAVSAAAGATRVGDLFDSRAPLASWAREAPDRLEVTDGAGKTHTLRGNFAHRLSLVNQGRPVIVAASDRGELLWWDPELRGSTPDTYALDAPVVSLKLTPDGASVVATTSEGQVMHLQPERLEGGGPPEPDAPAGGVREEAEGIRLPGVFIRRKRTR